MRKKIIGSSMIAILLMIGGWLVFKSPLLTDNSLPASVNQDGTSIIEVNAQEVDDRPVKKFNLTAEKKEWKISKEKKVDAWTYNGTVPGEEIRVTEGDYVKIQLKNELDVPVTIHWHGVLLPNEMDGVPGLTQDAVQPGESFTYEFIAGDAGTYWYHSHQHSSLQVDKGLYGALVVEEKKKKYDKDEIFILDEWAVNQDKQNLSNIGGMMMGSMSGDGEADTKQMYDTFTINGKAGSSIEPLVLKEGETARLRFINAGYQVHRLVFPEDSIEVIETDGEEVSDKTESSNVLEIAPGERIDVAFTKQDGEPAVIGQSNTIENAEDMKIPVVTKKDDVSAAMNTPLSSNTSVVDGTTFGSENVIFTKVPANPDVTYNMDLSMGMDMGEGMAFQINDETFPNTPPIQVESGDIVKVEITNSGRMNHPMHLHGHRFQVTSKNGEELNAPFVKDLIHVKPGETYTIYFKANNQGEWLFHCHDNNHADRGMVTIVDYKGVYSPFELGGKNNNSPN
ncbi:multicopper oxidase family protein [Guptibacillus sedimenti]|uniref:multicopper oxidase family protein n=1 Tax=Guptibacillus sedimenti TaxID=3025680 RepID=UPI002361F169|nr:multicopper oxidase family protein [Pseudalkalibacillus sedimenti]